MAKTIHENELMLRIQEMENEEINNKKEIIQKNIINTELEEQNIENIRHFLSDEVYEKYSNIIKQLQAKNQIQVYDELNVSDTTITGIEEFDDRFEINVKLLTKYLDYRISKDTKKYLNGNKDVRVEKYVRLRFSKIKNAKALGNARKCTGCGANIDLNKNGICEYCGSVYVLRDYGWVLEEINE